MALVESKKLLTKNLIFFAVVQFVIYMLSFYFLYEIKEGNLSAKTWRILLVLSVLAAIWTSLVPAITRQKSENIRIKNSKNYSYYNMLVPLIIYIGYFIVIAYLNWSFNITKENLYELCYFYIFISPCSGLLILMILADLS
ncbi:hypothetical protein C4O09_004427 [Salmonella enterica subsp. enterica serovar Minnesota]|nr:hypothetical protein [Salmonella enterica subsp. enterica serovar Minnesota]